MKGLKVFKTIKKDNKWTLNRHEINFFHLLARFEAFICERLHMSVLDIDNSKPRLQKKLVEVICRVKCDLLSQNKLYMSSLILWVPVDERASETEITLLRPLPAAMNEFRRTLASVWCNFCSRFLTEIIFFFGFRIFDLSKEGFKEKCPLSQPISIQ